jgi:hypothetical protein
MIVCMLGTVCGLWFFVVGGTAEAQIMAPVDDAASEATVVPLIPSGGCFAPGVSPLVAADVEAQMRGNSYLAVDRWPGTMGEPITLTWSLVPDGVNMPGTQIVCPETGLVVTEADAPNELFFRMNSQFSGNQAAWIAVIEQAMASWSRISGVRLVRVRNGTSEWDDGAGWGQAGSSTRGDIRIAMRPFHSCRNGTLAYAFYPGGANAGDVTLNSGVTWSDGWSNSGMRATIMHEIGHALGLGHTCPQNRTKIMEPQTNVDPIPTPQQDDIRGIQRLYGDAFEPNNTRSTASDVGTLAYGATRSMGIVPNMQASSASAAGISGAGDVDWYRFNIEGSQRVTVTVAPVGSLYGDEPHDGNGVCPASTGGIANARFIADLAFDITNASGTVLQSVNATGLGGTESVVSSLLTGPGPFYVKVREVSAPLQSQLYEVSLAGSCPAPRIATQPTNQTICQGATATFTVIPIQCGSTTFQWRRNGVPIVSGSGIFGFQSPQLSLSGLGLQPGSYDCVLTNTEGSVISLAASWSYYPNTVVTSHPASVTVCEGTPVTLVAAASGPYSSVAWTRDGSVVQGAVAPTLAIGAVSPGNVGTYRAVFTGPCGTVTTNPAQVARYTDPPSVIAVQSAVSMCPTIDAVLAVTATGRPPLRYQWLDSNSVPIPGATQPSLAIVTPEARDEGYYTCVVTDTCGIVGSAGVRARFFANCPPTLTWALLADCYGCGGNIRDIYSVSHDGRKYAGIRHASPVGRTVLGEFGVSETVLQTTSLPIGLSADGTAVMAWARDYPNPPVWQTLTALQQVTTTACDVDVSQYQPGWFSSNGREYVHPVLCGGIEFRYISWTPEGGDTLLPGWDYHIEDMSSDLRYAVITRPGVHDAVWLLDRTTGTERPIPLLPHWGPLDALNRNWNVQAISGDGQRVFLAGASPGGSGLLNWAVWSEANGTVDLGTIQNLRWHGVGGRHVLDVSYDGQLVVGGQAHYYGFWVWSPSTGARPLDVYLRELGLDLAEYPLLPENGDLLEPRLLSGDGSTLVCLASRGTESWWVVIRGLRPAAPAASELGASFSSDAISELRVTVRYNDDQQVSWGSVDSADIELRHSSGTAYPAALRSRVVGPQDTITATYAFSGPGGAWDSTDNGTYTLWLRPNQVWDNEGRAAPAGAIKTYNLWFNNPTATLQGQFVAEGGTFFEAITRYRDAAGSPIGISWGSVTNGDLELAGPGGYLEASTLMTRSIPAVGQLLAMYRFPARGGYWDWTDNGAYTLRARANQVWDAQGYPVAPTALQTYSMYFQTPNAVVSNVSVTRGTTDFIATVAYRANARFMDWNSLGSGDIELRGPNGLRLQSTLVSRSYAASNNSYTVVYRLPAPGGSWDSADNGSYSLWVRPSQVQDSLGFRVPEVQLAAYGLWF